MIDEIWHVVAGGIVGILMWANLHRAMPYMRDVLRFWRERRMRK